MSPTSGSREDALVVPNDRQHPDGHGSAPAGLRHTDPRLPAWRPSLRCPRVGGSHRQPLPVGAGGNAAGTPCPRPLTGCTYDAVDHPVPQQDAPPPGVRCEPYRLPRTSPFGTERYNRPSPRPTGMGNGRNHLYSTTALTDDVGNVVERYTYDAYGKRYVRDDAGVLKADQSGMQAYGFTGRQLDTESGLWYFRARYFDDELGRFVNRDPAGYVDGMSLYSASFVPITTDAYGLWTQIDRKHTREYALICSNDKSDTWANLAEKAGMEPSEYNLWVTDDDTGNLTQDKTPKMTKTYRVPNILYISNDMSSRRNNRSLWSYVSFYKYDQIKREARAGKVMTKDGWPVKKQYTFGYVYIGHGSANGVYNLLPGMTSANRERRLRKHYSDHPWKYKGNGNGSWTPNQLQARVGHKVAYIEMFSCMSYYASPKFRTFHSVNGASVTYNYIIKLYARQKPTVYKDKIVNDGEIIRVPVLGVYFGPILPLRPTILHRGSPQRHGKLRYEY